jgi:hypothetical protein
MFGDNNYGASSGRYGGQPGNFAPYDDEFRDLEATEKATARVRYLRKQYFLVFVQQLIASWLIYEGLQKTVEADAHGISREKGSPINKFLLENSAWTYVIPLIIVTLLSLIAFFKRSLISKTPLNWLSYLLFTASFALVFGYISAAHEYPVLDANGNQVRDIGTNGGSLIFHHGTYNYLYAIFLASMISLALTVHTFTTKSELTFQSASLYVVGSVLFIVFQYLVFTDISLLINHIITVCGIVWGFYVVWENESVVSGT